MTIHLGHIFSFAGIKLLRIPLGIAIMALMASNIGPSGAGLWAMYLAAGGFFSSLFLNWTQSGFVKFGREEWICHQTFKRTLAVRKSLIGVGFGISLLFLLTQPGNFLEDLFHLPGECWIEIFVVTAILWLQAETQSIFRITGQFKKQILAQIATDLIAIGYLWLLLKFTSFENPHQLFVGLLFFLGVGWFAIWCFAVLQPQKINFFHVQDLQNLRAKFLAYSWPIIPGMMFVYISNWGNHVLIYSFSTSEDVGYFDAAYQVTIAFISITSSLSILYLPHLIEMKLRDENAETIFFNRTVPILVVLWIAGTVFGLMLLPWLFLMIFGPLYTPAMIILNVLSVAIPGSAILALYAISFELNNRLRQGTIYSGVMIVFNLLFAWLLVPYLGGLGVAIGITISYVFLQLIYLIDFHGFNSFWKVKMFYMFVFATIFGIAQALIGNDPTIRLFLGSLSILLLAVIAYSLKILDLAAIREILPSFILKHK
jgi:O-antigen/teichoic acid export membrane protein